MNLWAFLSRNLISLLTIVSGCTVLVLQQFGLVTGDNIYTATLAILVLLATTEVVDKNMKLDKIEDLIVTEFKRITQESKYAKVLKFPTPEEGFQFLANKLKNCRLSIEHATLAPSPPRWFTERRNFSEAREKVLKENKIIYKYIIWGSKDQLEIPKHVNEWLSNPDIKRVFVSYLEKPNYNVLGISFMIFDKSSVAAYMPSVSGDPEVLIALEHPILLEAFTNYFRRLWEDSKRLNRKTDEYVL